MRLIIWDICVLTLIEGPSDLGVNCTDDWVAMHSLENSSESHMAETAWSHNFPLQPSHLCFAGSSHSQLSIYPIHKPHESLLIKYYIQLTQTQIQYTRERTSHAYFSREEERERGITFARRSWLLLCKSISC